MLFLEEHVRLFLVVHGLVAFALVAASTHLVLWLRSYAKGKPKRHAATVRFAWITLCLYLVTFFLGNMIYPVYKVRVRLEFLENTSAIAQRLDHAAQSSERTANLVAESRRYRTGGSFPVVSVPTIPPEDAAHEGAVVARWFDIKEHLVVLGLLLSIVCALTLTFWRPRDHGLTLAKPVFAFAVASSTAAWFALLVGLLTASVRAVGTW